MKDIQKYDYIDALHGKGGFMHFSKQNPAIDSQTTPL